MVATFAKLREDFAQFGENLSREALARFIALHIGEQAETDFKAMWQVTVEVARDVIGFANSGGGVIVLGVEEKADGTFEAQGLAEVRDENNVRQALERFLPRPLQDMYRLTCPRLLVHLF